MKARKYQLILGLGKSGASIARYFADQSNVLLADTRLARRKDLVHASEWVSTDIACHELVAGDELDKFWREISTVYVSPGIPLHHPYVREAQRAGVRVSSDLDLFLADLTRPVIAVTGTNGKSTVVELTVELLSSMNFIAAGNIGTPALNVKDTACAGYVLEVSSFQLERLTRARFNVATCLNIAEDHIAEHGSFEKYVRAKHRVYEACDFAIYDACDPQTKPATVSRSLAINSNQQWSVQDDGIVVAGVSIPAHELGLKGAHNRFNAVVAAACAYQYNVPVVDMLPILKRFKGLSHRLQELPFANDVTCINDSKSTNVASTIAALQASTSMARPLVLMMGGESKELDFNPLYSVVKQYVDHLVFYGRDRNRLRRVLGESTSSTVATDFESATRAALQHAEPNGTVLLSPGCASFDIFANFEERGERFRNLCECYLNSSTERS